jgi:hypothetical protein
VLPCEAAEILGRNVTSLEQIWGLVDPLSDDADDEDRAARAQLKGKFARRMSASQIEEFLRCPRKWALHRLAGVPRIKGEALRFGIALHLSLKWYLEDRLTWQKKVRPNSRIGRLTVAMARCVPIKPGDQVTIEGEWLLSVDELETDIYIKPDLMISRGSLTFIDDWKSTSAPNARHPWALQGLKLWEISEDEADRGEHVKKLPAGARTLWHNVQARLYSHGAVKLFGAPSTTQQWVYGNKKSADGAANPKVWSVIETFEASSTAAWIEQYVFPVVRLMNRLRAAWEAGDIDSPLLIPHRGEGCEFVGKFCDALGPCGLKKSPIDAEDFRRFLPMVQQ